MSTTYFTPQAKFQATASELRSEIHRHISALEERKRELLQKVDTVRQSKLATLKGQTDTITHRRALIIQVRTSGLLN